MRFEIKPRKITLVVDSITYIASNIEEAEKMINDHNNRYFISFYVIATKKEVIIKYGNYSDIIEDIRSIDFN